MFPLASASFKPKTDLKTADFETWTVALLLKRAVQIKLPCVALDAGPGPLSDGGGLGAPFGSRSEPSDPLLVHVFPG